MKRTAGSYAGAREKAGPVSLALSVLGCLIAGLIGASGCAGDRTGTIIETSPRIDPLLSYDKHDAIAGALFSLDLAPYLSDDQDEPWELFCEVIAGGGFFSSGSGQTYENTFTTAGVYYIIIRVTDSTSNVTESYFSVNVDYVGNTPPFVSASIPTQTAYLGVDFYFNVGSYVTDDIDPVADLDYSLTAGPGEFIGPIYYNVFGSLGSVTVDFVVTDSGGKSGSGSFMVDVVPVP